MRPRVIKVRPESVVELLKTMSFTQVASKLRCSSNTLRVFMREHGLYANGALDPVKIAEDTARVEELRRQGLSAKKIAESIGRSQQFVAARIPGSRAFRPKNSEQYATQKRLREPHIELVPEKSAMTGVRFEDVRTKPGRLEHGVMCARKFIYTAPATESYQTSTAAYCADTL